MNLKNINNLLTMKLFQVQKLAFFLSDFLFEPTYNKTSKTETKYELTFILFSDLPNFGTVLRPPVFRVQLLSFIATQTFSSSKIWNRTPTTRFVPSQTSCHVLYRNTIIFSIQNDLYFVGHRFITKSCHVWYLMHNYFLNSERPRFCSFKRFIVSFFRSTSTWFLFRMRARNSSPTRPSCSGQRRQCKVIIKQSNSHWRLIGQRYTVLGYIMSN